MKRWPMRILMYKRKNKRRPLPIVNKTIKQGEEDDWNSKEGLWGTQVLNKNDKQIVHY